MIDSVVVTHFDLFPSLHDVPHRPHPIHFRIRALLRSTCNGAFTTAGRSAERDVITKFVTSARETGCPNAQLKSSLFISGAPGTGNTALVNSVLAGHEYCQDLKVITINCVALNGVDDIWDCLCKNIENSTLVKRDKGVKAKGKRLLDKILASQDHRWYLNAKDLRVMVNDLLQVSYILAQAR